jgi:hypothetical protein
MSGAITRSSRFTNWGGTGTFLKVASGHRAKITAWHDGNPAAIYNPRVRTHARLAFAVAAVLAWLGTGMRVLHDLLLSPRATQSTAGLFGNYRGNFVGSLQRVFDDLSYFTHWSNLAVAVTWTLLALDPSRDSPLFRAARNTALVMITMTGILYVVLIAPTDVVTGWFNVSDNIVIHYLNPPVAVLVWALWGPRGWFRWRDAWRIYPLPLTYLAYTLVRGALTHTYPYAFFNVVLHGYANVMVTMLTIIGESLILIAAFVMLDRLLTGASTAPRVSASR